MRINVCTYICVCVSLQVSFLGSAAVCSVHQDSRAYQLRIDAMTISTSEAVVSPACLTSRFHIQNQGAFLECSGTASCCSVMWPWGPVGNCGGSTVLGYAAQCLPLLLSPATASALAFLQTSPHSWVSDITATRPQFYSFCDGKSSWLATDLWTFRVKKEATGVALPHSEVIPPSDTTALPGDGQCCVDFMPTPRRDTRGRSSLQKLETACTWA